MRSRFTRRVQVQTGLSLALLVGVGSPSLASASDFDAKTGVVVFAPNAVKTYGFESAAEIAASKIFTTKWDNAQWPPSLRMTPATAATVEPFLTTAPADAIQGTRALRVGSLGTAASVGFAILDDALFAQLASSRVEIAMWGRGDGTPPSIVVQYAKPEWSLESGFDFASVSAMRTGRETTDGWIEYTTGPIDGSVWGAPIRALVLAPSSQAPKQTSFLVDAVEIKKAPGSLQAANACTQLDVETTCGAGGDCMYGHCVSSTVTWGALPTPAHRVEFAERWITLGARIIGDRASSEFGRTTFTPAARDLAKYALSSRQFFGGINRLVNGLRDNHTSFGSPPAGFNTFSPMVFYGWSGALHACFGVVEKDLLGGGLGFGVFHAGDKPITGVPLKPGDVLVAIDGKDPKEWADAVMPGVDRTSPNDPRAAMAAMAENLAAVITSRARNITIARCASATACKDADKTEITIDVAGKMYPQLAENGGFGDIDYFGCSPRFKDSVSEIVPLGQGEDDVTAESKDGIVNVQFDGFSGDGGWKGKFSEVFDAKPAMVVMDTRLGNGGTGDNVEHLLHLMRGKDEPIGFITVVNGAYDDPTPADIFTTWEPCVTGGDAGFSFKCAFGAWGFFSNLDAPTGAGSKVAWINTQDVSANDYMPRLLKGRSKLRIFAPHPTSGAFGAVTSFSPFMTNFGGGSIQYQDSRFAPTYGDFSAARWESGNGVEPDQVIAQKMSDALLGKDTMIEAAHAWLRSAQ